MATCEGIVACIVFRNEDNGYTVASIKEKDARRLQTVVGTLPFLARGEYAVFEGTLSEHSRYGTQFTVTGYSTKVPDDESAAERYLAAGIIKGIGPKTAHALVREFGVEVFDAFASPEKLTRVKGISETRAQEMAKSYAEHNAQRTNVMFLQKFGISPTLTLKICNTYGEMTEGTIRKNPYCLADDVSGVGFTTADNIAQMLGFASDSPFRIRSGIRYTLSEAVSSAGHTYLPEEELVTLTQKKLNMDKALIRTAIKQLQMEDALRLDTIHGIRAVYLPGMLRAEKETARLLLKLCRNKPDVLSSREEVDAQIAEFERINDVTLHARQKDAVFAAVTGGVTIITGGPGTGKTTSIDCILYLLRHLQKIELCAPTGRAAKRMSEAADRPARTIHRLLEYSGEFGDFSRNEKKPLDADFIIVDEVSMVDLSLMRALLRALKPGARLLLVGDADQLPSVGAGNVLRDLLDSGVVPSVCLTEIFRQANESMIVVNAHRINHGEMPILRTTDTDFFFEHRNDSQSVVESVVTLLKDRLPKYLGLPDSKGIQVMAPMRQNSPLGVDALNLRLQAELNPPDVNKREMWRNSHVFRLGDRVMQIRNNYDMAWTQNGTKGKGVFNGDIGYITKVGHNENYLCVLFDDGRLAEYDRTALEELEIAYCMTVHKSQGSEFEAVILPLLGGPKMLMVRNLLYTAVTRAKRLVVIVGQKKCVMSMVDNNRITQRYSALAERLRGEQG